MANLSDRIANKAALARDLGCNRTYLVLVLAGRRRDGTRVRPSVDLAKRIEAASSGAIRWQEFFDDALAHQDPPKAGAA